MTDSIRVLVIDDDEMFLRIVTKRLSHLNFAVHSTTNGEEAIGIAAKGLTDVALLDIHMPNLNGFDVLRGIKEKAPQVQVIMMTAFADFESVLTAMRLGAYDYLPKPFARFDEVCDVIERAARGEPKDNDEAELKAKAVDPIEHPLVGSSVPMKRVYRLIKKVANSDAPVLIVGESGTGKELIAREIHRRSKRAERPWVPVNCAALPENLIESELFGYVKGAFTGALYDKRGLLLAAHQGTLFLDEIGDLQPITQTKLLRVLQEREVRPLGATRELPVDFRLICATNVDLEALVREKKFREDLYYRIDVVKIEVPPLRQRPDDIPELAEHFLQFFCEAEGVPLKTLTPAAIKLLKSMQFKGNVRELQNVIFRAVVMSEGEVVDVDAIDARGGEHSLEIGDESAGTEVSEEIYGMPYSEAKKVATESFEKQYIQNALQRSDGKIAAAARLAQLDRSNFKRIVKRHQINTDEYGDED